MDVVPPPALTALRSFEALAEALAAASQAGSGAVRLWAEGWLGGASPLVGASPSGFVQGSIDRAVEHLVRHLSGESMSLAAARGLVAQAYGFGAWAEFAGFVEEMARPGSASATFEAAADAVVAGDLAALARVLDEGPALIRARSSRRHHATLLHYVSANGVEDFRQRSTADSPAVAELLLARGAVVDALADTYRGGRDQTTMNLLVSSVHPAAAGVQDRLVEVLLDAGAAINGLEDNCSPLMTALAFGHISAAETLARRGARVDNILAASGLGRVERLPEFVANGHHRREARLATISWMSPGTDPDQHMRLALVWACRYGRTAAAAWLLDHGVPVAAADVDGFTGLHLAAALGHLDLIELLLTRGAPLEATNRWGGTVLGSTRWFARNDPAEGVDYPAIERRLIAAGAHIPD